MSDTVTEPVVDTAPSEPEVKEVNDTQDTSLTGMKTEEPNTKIVDSAPDVQTAPKEEYNFDPRLYNEDGTFNKDGAKEFLSESKEREEKYEKRILDLRRKVSDGKAPESKDKYFQDFAPSDEKYMPFFDESAPEETKKIIGDISEKLSERYLDSALTTRQADDMTNAILDIMGDVGLLDTKTKEEKYVERQGWIESQKQDLGPEADNIIRVTRNFVENTHLFDAKTKNTFIELMETAGAPVISALYQIQEGKTGDIPTNVSNLGGLPSDVELKDEYMNPNTSDARRNEIIKQRALAGRKSRLMDAGND